MKNFKYLMAYESYSILGRVETVIITNEDGQTVTAAAKIDTGSYSSRISADIAKELKLPVIDQKKIKSVMGEENRTFVELQFKISGIEIKTVAGIADMDGLRNQVSIGRKDIEMVDGLVDVKKNNNKPIEEAPLPMNPTDEESELPPNDEDLESSSIAEERYEIEEPVNEEIDLNQLDLLHKKYDKNYDGRFEIEEEKYFVWTDKSEKSKKSVDGLTKNHIEENYDINEEDCNGVILEEFLENCNIGDVWESHTEKFGCDKIY